MLCIKINNRKKMDLLKSILILLFFQKIVKKQARLEKQEGKTKLTSFHSKPNLAGLVFCKKSRVKLMKSSISLFDLSDC